MVPRHIGMAGTPPTAAIGKCPALCGVSCGEKNLSLFSSKINSIFGESGPHFSYFSFCAKNKKEKERQRWRAT